MVVILVAKFSNSPNKQIFQLMILSVSGVLEYLMFDDSCCFFTYYQPTSPNNQFFNWWFFRPGVLEHSPFLLTHFFIIRSAGTFSNTGTGQTTSTSLTLRGGMSCTIWSIQHNIILGKYHSPYYYPRHWIDVGIKLEWRLGRSSSWSWYLQPSNVFATSKVVTS